MSADIMKKAASMEGAIRRRRVTVSEGLKMTLDQYDAVYEWFSTQIANTLSSEIAVAYRCWSRDRGRNQCIFAEDSYIMCEPIDPVIEQLLKVLRTQKDLLPLVRRLYKDKPQFKAMISDILTESQINVYKKHGPLRKTLDDMFEKHGMASLTSRRSSRSLNLML